MVWTDEQLDELREIGDPVADDVVKVVFAEGEVDLVNELLRRLVRDRDPSPDGLPDEVAEYMAAGLTLPSFAEPARIRNAEDLFQTAGVPITLSLFCASLPSAYAAAKGVKVLHLTGRLDTDFERRIMETGQLLMDVMAPGGLGPGGDGLRSIQRVRLMHAAIRHLIIARAAERPGMWNPQWGHPINQEDLAGTMLSFSFVVGEPLPRLGVDVSKDQANDYIHTWSVIASLLGLRDELLVHDLPSARELVETIRQRQFASSPEGHEMTAALITFLEHHAPPFARSRLVPAIVRHLITDPVADLLAVPAVPRHGWVIDEALADLAGLADTVVVRDAAVRRLAEPFAKTLMHDAFDMVRGGTRAPFAIPTELARSWELDPGPVYPANLPAAGAVPARRESLFSRLLRRLHLGRGS